MQGTLQYNVVVLWFILFIVSVILICIGIYIAKINYFSIIEEAFKRAKGKSMIPLSSLELGYLKDIFCKNNLIVVIGGNESDREGMVDYIKSYNMDKHPIYTVENVDSFGIDYIKELLNISNVTVIVPYKDDNFTHFYNLSKCGIIVDIIVQITTTSKSVATVYTYSDGDYITVKDYLDKEIKNEEA